MADNVDFTLHVARDLCGHACIDAAAQHVPFTRSPALPMALPIATWIAVDLHTCTHRYKANMILLGTVGSMHCASHPE